MRASREVILSGGAFNTPQLLMLSGIGPQAELDRYGIKHVQILDGVGKNLQDRYEVGVVHRLDRKLKSLENADFRKGDGPYVEWANRRSGVYTTNGAVLAVIRKSKTERPLPDLFCFGLVGNFHGYFPGYSKLFGQEQEHDRLTWAVLKAHTLNRGGEVTLKSADPRVAPAVNFHYFDEGTDKSEQDLDSVVEGIKFVRRLTANLPFVKEEEFPGRGANDDRALREFVKNNAWGHHASCSCQIGERGPGRQRLRFRLPGTRRQGTACRGRLHLPEDSRVLYRQFHLHGGGESRGRHSRKLQSQRSGCLKWAGRLSEERADTLYPTRNPASCTRRAHGVNRYPLTAPTLDSVRRR